VRQTDARTSATASALHPKLDDLVQRVPVACTALRTFVRCGAGGARLLEPTRHAFSGVPRCRDASTKKSGGWDGILPNFAAASVLLRVRCVQPAGVVAPWYTVAVVRFFVVCFVFVALVHATATSTPRSLGQQRLIGWNSR